MINLPELRHKLHSIPELSGSEIQTSNIIYELLESLKPDTLLRNIGGHGILAVFDSGEPGNTVLFRADMDALPILEPNQVSYSSKFDGVSHKCGHDGHMTMLCGFAVYCAQNLPLKGKVILLFQPAEETGSGALNVLNDEKFAVYKPDYSFALHNLPGFPVNAVVLKDQTFAAASKGIIINLSGVHAHASEPEKGVSPGIVLSNLIRRLPLLANSNIENSDYSLITIVHASLGAPSFGTSPADAVIMLTLRAYDDNVMDAVTLQIVQTVEELTTLKKLKYSIGYTDVFPATVNHREAVSFVRNAANRLDLEMLELNTPFKWSEDFAHFTLNSKGTLFGIGSGVDHLSLHNPLYDFPDTILDTGVQIWKEIYQQLNF